MNDKQPAVVAIIGSGFSGTVLAAKLLRTSEFPLRILLFDRTGRFGSGLAYGTDAPEHLLNVPASKMSALPDLPSHFADWLSRNHLPGSEAPSTSFVPRRHYRRYLQELLQKAIQAPRNSGSNLEFLSQEVTEIESDNTLQTASGLSYSADRIVLTTGYLPESNLARANGGTTGFLRAYEPENWPTEGVRNVVIVGSRLTALDAALSVFARYASANVTVVSRYGYLPGLHDVKSPSLPLEIPKFDKGVRQIVQWLRSEVAKAAEMDLPWQSVFDAMRPHWERIWHELSIREKERFLEHLVRHFDRFRHRVSGEVAQALRSSIDLGMLRVVAGTVRPLPPNGAYVLVCGASGKSEEIQAELALDCSGASMNWVQSQEPLFRQLFNRGRVVQGPHGMGLVADDEGRLVDKDGHAGNIYAIGPMLRGVRWETTAVHELRHQVDVVAEAVLAFSEA